MKKKIDLIWAVSLIIIGAATLVLAGSNIAGMELPDAAVRICGAVDLLALPALAYSALWKVRNSSKR